MSSSAFSRTPKNRLGKMQKKSFLANILYSSNLLNLFRSLPLYNKLIVLNYHRIRPDEPDFVTPFDDGVFNLNASQFAMQIKWLKTHTHILSEQDLLDLSKSPKKPSRTGILITFDDGYRDNFTIAYPILKAYEVPALFFIPTKLIDTRRVGWWDLIAYIVKKSPKPEVIFADRRFSLTKDRQAVTLFFDQKMKLEKFEKNRRLIDDMLEAFEVDRPSLEIQDEQLLTWDQIKEMTADIIAIGSHCHSHRVLATLDPIAQREEMSLSRLILEQKTGHKISSIAYPVGGPHHFTLETLIIARECGYLLGFTCDTGVNLWDIEDLYAVKRVSSMLEDIRTVSALVVLPNIFMWKKAVARHQDTLRDHPDYADFSFRLGVIYLGQGKIENAIEMFQDALQNNPNYVEARIKLGLSQAYIGQYAEAHCNLQTVLAKHPTYADVHYLLGIIRSGQGNIEKAIQSFKQTLTLNPAYKDAKIKLGTLYFHSAQYVAGLKQLEEASRIDPGDEDLKSTVVAGRKIIHTHQKSEEKIEKILLQNLFGGEESLLQAIESFTTHIEISPNLSDILTIITNFSEEGDALEILVPLLEDYIAQYPGYADLHNTFGTLHLKLSRLDEAEGCFRRAVELSPKFVKARLNLFNTLKRQEKFEQALAQMQLIDDFNLPYADIYHAQAEVYFKLARYDEAIFSLKKALDLNPEYAPAQLLLAKIYAGR